MNLVPAQPLNLYIFHMFIDVDRNVHSRVDWPLLAQCISRMQRMRSIALGFRMHAEVLEFMQVHGHCFEDIRRAGKLKCAYWHVELDTWVMLGHGSDQGKLMYTSL